VGVPLVATDLIDRALREADDVEWVEADLGRRGVVADRLLIAAAHVDRDRPARGLAVAELVEERLQRGGVAARGAPHDRSAAVVDDRGQIALVSAVADLVNTDGDQAGQPALVEAVGDDPRNDPSDGVSADPEQAGDRRLGHLLG
jgi:hypothetical protein